MKVYVCFTEVKYSGMDAPEAVFDSEEKATAWVIEQRALHNTKLGGWYDPMYFEMDVL